MPLHDILMIHRALANNPDVLLLDEVTGDLDEANGQVCPDLEFIQALSFSLMPHRTLWQIVMKILTDLNVNKGVTCIMVTHDVALKSYAHRVIRMVDGKISRIESTPDFVRRDALDTLAASAPVRAIAALRLDQASQQPDAYAGQHRDAGDILRSRGGWGGVAWSRLDDNDQASEAGVWGTLSWAARGVQQTVQSLLQHAGLASGAPVVAPSPRARMAPTPSGSINMASAPGSRGVTSTGLSGVAAISHAMFAGRSLAASTHANGDVGVGVAHGIVGGSRSIVRTPESYPTFTFAVRARAVALQEEMDRQKAAAAKEERLRAALMARQESRATAMSTS